MILSWEESAGSGKRSGLERDRELTTKELAFSFLEAFRTRRPKYIVWEEKTHNRILSIIEAWGKVSSIKSTSGYITSH